MIEIERLDDVARAPAPGPDVRVLAGGTLVMRALNYGGHGIGRILRLTDPALREIHSEGGGVRIGAAATMADVLAAPDLAALHPAAQVVGGPAIRNMATVGGNLFAPHPYGDFAMALLAANAQVHWADGRAEPIEAMLGARGRSAGIVAAVTVPRLQHSEFRFRKVSRTKPKGVSLMSIAAHLPRAGGRLGDVRIGFGAMGDRPLRATGAEQALSGRSLDPAAIDAACAACLDGLAPADDPLASEWYRRQVAPIHLRRLLEEVR
ncbi:FAD binding domain-containing protein [Roseisalinus antarcticus]|uniref:Carbon monoxide dehydrogenase medium chain n=1 Tax=Roseisalinus antarcticus TaxID=254357 RepID=A0A1Y5TI19_9RHOB|nr:FAD binding domain-containing protein [Roseisalinus antarcticus]SLN64137.1 Carbon monoxide dehydrogenase medium chain [Roseisalinus antarcticus]